jgi:uncharacterized protein YkwD
MNAQPVLAASLLTAAQALALPDTRQAEQMVVELTNELRRDNKLDDLKSSDVDLEQTARYFANFMARTDLYGHEADGDRPAERAQIFGYEFCIVDENIAWQFSSDGFAARELARSFYEGWRDSPPHRRNMLDPDVIHTAMAIAFSPASGKYYGVQMFGRPRSAAITFKIVNRTDAALRYRVAEKTYDLPARYNMSHLICRTAELGLTWPQGAPTASGRREDTIAPENGARYVLGLDDQGRYRIDKESASTSGTSPAQ